MLTKVKPAGSLDGCAQFGMLRQDERGCIATFQSKFVPHHERARRRRSHLPRDQSKHWLARRALHALQRDDACRILPCGEAVAHRQDAVLILEVAAREQLVLHGRDRCENGCGIARGVVPFFPDQAEHVLRQTRTR